MSELPTAAYDPVSKFQLPLIYVIPFGYLLQVFSKNCPLGRMDSLKDHYVHLTITPQKVFKIGCGHVVTCLMISVTFDHYSGLTFGHKLRIIYICINVKSHWSTAG